MRFGKIEYINLLPFDVFLKSYPIHTRFKLSAFAHKSYPAKLNQAFFFRRIDAGFISNIAAYKSYAKKKITHAGIIAKGAVWSVLAIDSSVLESTSQTDYQSNTSNVLSQVLKLSGSVLIGDRALRFRFENPALFSAAPPKTNARVVDMGDRWWDMHRLPFVFGRLCYNAHAELYHKLAHAFIKRRVKIPYYILREKSLESTLPPAFIKEYLTHIHYAITTKERVSIERFYRAVRLAGLKTPQRIYYAHLHKATQIHKAPRKPCALPYHSQRRK